MNLGGLCLVLMGSLITAYAVPARAESFFVPQACAPNQGLLTAHNTSSQPQAFWLQLKNPEQEIRYELSANAELQIPSSAFLQRPQGFSLRTWTDHNLEFRWRCDDLNFALDSAVTPLVSYDVTGALNVNLRLLNLSLLENQVQIIFFNNQNEEISRQKIWMKNYYETQNLHLNVPANARRLQIAGENRLNSGLSNSEGVQQNPSFLTPAPLNPSTQQKYFLVSTKQHNEQSFVIGIDAANATILAQARQQIANPALEKIIVARINLGNAGYNRSFSEQNHSPYSWPVTQVDSFSDFALNDCDGTPDDIENQLAQRMAEGGRICFWRYRVIRELSLQEVQRGY